MPEAELTERERRATSNAAEWPRITIVTAVRNGAPYIADTIRSIVNQGYPNLEYFVIDGASTDGTVEIIRQYEEHLAGWISEPDKGVYDALNKGFARSTGEVMGWLNASDMLHTHGLFAVGNIFSRFTEVEWITGRPTLIGEEGWPCVAMDLRRWSRHRFLAGANKHIQQESTFWRRGLWERAGGACNTEFRAEGDFELWVRFFRYAKLYTVDALIGGWRNHGDGLSRMDLRAYDGNCEAIIDRELAAMRIRGESELFCRLISILKHTRFVRGVWSRLVVRALYKWTASDWPPVIEYRKDQWKMRS